MFDQITNRLHMHRCAALLVLSAGFVDGFVVPSQEARNGPALPLYVSLRSKFTPAAASLLAKGLPSCSMRHRRAWLSEVAVNSEGVAASLLLGGVLLSPRDAFARGPATTEELARLRKGYEGLE